MTESLNIENINRFTDLILRVANSMMLKKVVLSKPEDKNIKKTVITLKSLNSGYVLQSESFYTDNKAKHENIPLNYASNRLSELISKYGQANLITSNGECEYRCSKSKNSVIIGALNIEKAMSLSVNSPAKIIPGKNNNEKAYILKGNEDFLRYLGVSDANGRVYDKKQAKFRQINRFLELVRDIQHALPEEGVLRICDLCCGKSYLSFAVYYYFVKILNRKVRMTGVDLKDDVINYCNEVSNALGYDGLNFISGDIRLYNTDEHVNLVISLHACDVATDIVLEKAIDWRADVILSTPCCHHYMNHHLSCDTLSFISEHSMLRQKFCDAATDALRLKLLESKGYSVSALELIDPEETPKNIMLRGVRKQNFDPKSPHAIAAKEEYNKALSFLYNLTDCDLY